MEHLTELFGSCEASQKAKDDREQLYFIIDADGTTVSESEDLGFMEGRSLRDPMVGVGMESPHPRYSQEKIFYPHGLVRIIVTTDIGTTCAMGQERALWNLFMSNHHDLNSDQINTRLIDMFCTSHASTELAKKEGMFSKDSQGLGFTLSKRTVQRDMRFDFSDHDGHATNKFGVYQIGHAEMELFEKRDNQTMKLTTRNIDGSVDDTFLVNLNYQVTPSSPDDPILLSGIINHISGIVNDPNKVLNFIIYACRGQEAEEA